MTLPRNTAKTPTSWPYAHLLDLLVPLRASERSCAAKLLAMAELETGMRLLDVGCGSGDLLVLAATAEPGALLVGIDSDSDALAVARRKLRRTQARVYTYRSGAESLPLADAFFDVVTCSFVLHRLPAPLRIDVLLECLRVLRPGGRLLVADWRTPDALLPPVLRRWLEPMYGLTGRAAPPDRVTAQDLVRAGFDCVEPALILPAWTGLVDIVCGEKPEC